ncbi:MAG: apolipoprotein N-acyltransferase [Pseudomonadota bacterium]|nr:apolipoprotein N-acyltransferase [Pseudomonadota bacterium]
MNFLFALLIGVASAFAFQPFGLWPLMPLAFAALCELIARAPTLRRAMLIGWGFSVGQFCVGLNWIATAFTYQAAMPAWLGWIAVVLLSFYLAAFMMLSAGLAWRFGRERRIALVLALAGSWALCEYLRSTMFTGFAWNPVGSALVDTPWRLVSRFVGTYGLTLLTVLAGGGLWLAAKREWRPAGGVLLAVGLLLLLPRPLPSGPPGLVVFDAQDAPVRPSKIRIIQPNIGQQDKWTEGFGDVAAARLNAMSGVRDDRPELIFWPEAAVTDPLDDDRPLARPFITYERQRATRNLGRGDVLLTGGLAFASRDGRTVDSAANSVFVFTEGGNPVGRYDKAHLVPYGEYLPMRPLLSAFGLSRLAPGDLDFAPGPGPRSIQLPFGWGKVGFQLCYEIIFSGEVIDPADRPDFLFNPSNDAWFGRWGPPQHLAQSRMRAAEEGIPVIRSTPTGISAVVDARGELLHALPWRTAGVIETDLPRPLPNLSLFARFGNVIPMALGFALLFAAIALGQRARYRKT